jgi:uncharacterized protein (TIGR02145 family)
VCMFLAGPGLAQSSTEYSLTARVEGTVVVLELGWAHADLSTASHEQPQFFYSEDAGATWLPIPSNCLAVRLGADQPTWVWNPLSCLGRKEWIGNKIRFKAQLSSCVSSVTFHGYNYRVVSIGEQCWFAENLRSDRYRNGDPIPSNLNRIQWSETRSGAQAIYKSRNLSLAEYGRLYNYYAVRNSKGLCPAGWHVSSDEDWMELERALGIPKQELSELGARGKGQGTQLKSSRLSSPPWNGSNTVDFGGLPAGLRYNDGDYSLAGRNGYWWSLTEIEFAPIHRIVYSGSPCIYRNSCNKSSGYSVRCVQD